MPREKSAEPTARERGISFPETDKLIKLSKLFECSTDFLLNEDIQENAENSIDVSIDASYNVNTRKWIRVNGKAEVENSIMIRDEMMNKYLLLKQKFFDETEMFLVIFKLIIEKISIY